MAVGVRGNDLGGLGLKVQIAPHFGFPSDFGLRISGFFRHLSFVIRHSCLLLLSRFRAGASGQSHLGSVSSASTGPRARPRNPRGPQSGVGLDGVCPPLADRASASPGPGAGPPRAPPPGGVWGGAPPPPPPRPRPAGGPPPRSGANAELRPSRAERKTAPCVTQLLGALIVACTATRSSIGVSSWWPQPWRQPGQLLHAGRPRAHRCRLADVRGGCSLCRKAKRR